MATNKPFTSAVSAVSMKCTLENGPFIQQLKYTLNIEYWTYSMQKCAGGKWEDLD